MSHFAKVIDGVVQEVIVAEQDFIDMGLVGEPSLWMQTSYNTRGGIHYEPNSNTPSADQSKALRKNYAGIGYTYDAQRDAFIPPPIYSKWVLNEQSCIWESPIPYPTDGARYAWDDGTESWIKAEDA